MPSLFMMTAQKFYENIKPELEKQITTLQPNSPKAPPYMIGAAILFECIVAQIMEGSKDVCDMHDAIRAIVECAVGLEEQIAESHAHFHKLKDDQSEHTPTPIDADTKSQAQEEVIIHDGKTYTVDPKKVN